ncbi:MULTISPECIES: hypothetical protein [unclassified Roseitalea]|uniref:hypothetical protein n=1 Tax=unclassified Roseitalea TaxID=2639107 RepID=UPI002740186B|nr:MULTISPECIES: hypothetical protein [unclassified Roseitalea]
MLNVVCMKWGNKYPSYYVNRLHAGVQRWLERDFRFICFTDDSAGVNADIETHPLPEEEFEAELIAGMQRRGRKGAWRKISLLRPGLADMEGPILGFDLDVAIAGPLDAIVDFAPQKVAMRREWRYEWQGRDGGHGSVFCLEPHLHPYLYEEFAADPAGAIDRHKGSEQYYTSMTALRHGSLAYLPGDLICSFKRNAIPAWPFNYLRAPVLPDNCRVMCFHGRPSMEEAMSGYRRTLRYRCKPADWLARCWFDPAEALPTASRRTPDHAPPCRSF